MSNLIPPLLSSSPPPIVASLDEDGDDEFGDFCGQTNAYDCDDFSLPASPQKKTPEEEVKVNLDINSNSKEKVQSTNEKLGLDKVLPVDVVIDQIEDPGCKGLKEDSSAIPDSCEINVNSSNSVSENSTNLSKTSLKDLETVNNTELNLEKHPHSTIADGCIDLKSIEDYGFCDFQSTSGNYELPDCVSDLDGTENVQRTARNHEENEVVSESSPSKTNECEDIERRDQSGSRDESSRNSSSDVKEGDSDDDFGDFESNSIKEEDAVPVEEPNQIDQPIEGVAASLEYRLDHTECTASDDSETADGQEETVDTDDDFGHFATSFDNFEVPAFENVEIENSAELPPPPIDDDFDDFVTSSYQPDSVEPGCSSLQQESASSKVPTSEVEFEDFADFESFLPPQSRLDAEDDDDDSEFGDFGDFSTQPQFSSELETGNTPILQAMDVKDVLMKTNSILKDVFLCCEDDGEEFDYVDDTRSNFLFNELKDVTDTKALAYQWAKSHSQKVFLKALNIDTRNILYGPGWNVAMPRFASNLSFAPLEPVKSEILTPVPVQNVASPSSSSQKSQGGGSSDVPSVQFDWTDSGLVNPLDSTSVEPPVGTDNTVSGFRSRTISADVVTTSKGTMATPGKSLMLVEPEVQCRLEKTVSDSTLAESRCTRDVKSAEPAIDESIFEEFSSQIQSPKMFPLRETHIFNETSCDLTNKPGWLQPTILTPDLPRKEQHTDEQNEEDFGHESDEFDDFQMSLPVQNQNKVALEPSGGEVKFKDTPSSRFLGPNESKEGASDQISLPDYTHHSISKAFPSTAHIHKHSNEVEVFNSVPSEKTIDILAGNAVTVEDDDDFTDFHSSLPPPLKETSKPLQPVPLEPLRPVPLEPLKPSIQYSMKQPTQINWPDPGVTDFDIQGIELNYSRSPAVNDVKVIDEKKKAVQKESSVDDDEWSDFVSVPNPSLNLPDRTATPDLPLSVLNLGNVQPAKQPIPVITPSGLVQTKLSSNISLQPKNSSVVQTTVHQNHNSPQFHSPNHSNAFTQARQFQPPSIISSQFLGNMFQHTANTTTTSHSTPNFQTNNVQHTAFPNRGFVQGKANSADDDDWSDFVSSQPSPQVTNGFQQQNSSASFKHIQSWPSLTPNIITNPSHFDSFQRYVPPPSQQPGKVPQHQQQHQQQRNAIPSISAMPDLDFISPKNRTGKK